jgi:hypothetical protein
VKANAELGLRAPGDKRGNWAEALFFLSLIPGLKTGATEESVRMSVREVETPLNAREP